LDVPDDVRKAIAAHGLWKARLQDAVQAGRSDYRASEVALPHRCDFGRWLEAQPPSERGEAWVRIGELHAAFHLAAAAVLSRLEAGERAGAEQLLAHGEPYAMASSRLTMAMVGWSKQTRRRGT
jgi:hypothetical protein